MKTHHAKACLPVLTALLLLPPLVASAEGPGRAAEGRARTRFPEIELEPGLDSTLSPSRHDVEPSWAAFKREFPPFVASAEGPGRAAEGPGRAAEGRARTAEGRARTPFPEIELAQTGFSPLPMPARHNGEPSSSAFRDAVQFALDHSRNGRGYPYVTTFRAGLGSSVGASRSNLTYSESQTTAPGTHSFRDSDGNEAVLRDRRSPAGSFGLTRLEYFFKRGLGVLPSVSIDFYPAAKPVAEAEK